MNKSSCALVASLLALGISGTSFAAHADPNPAASAVPAIPAEYRAPLSEAGKTCPQVDAPLVAGILSAETGFRTDLTPPSGAVSVGNIPPMMWAKFAKPGEQPSDPAAGTHVTARYLCSVAADVEKISAGTSAEGKTALLVTAFSAGSTFATRLRDGSALADTSTPAILTETAAYTAKVLSARDEYKKQGI